MLKIHPFPTTQLRFYQQGSGEIQAAPLPAASPARLHRQTAPVDLDRGGLAAETLATLAHRHAAATRQSPAAVIAGWIDDYLMALTEWRLLQAPPLGLILLVEAAAPGLTAYAGQLQVNPDVIGQAFLACLDDAAAWQAWFLPWPEALDRARQFIPDGHETASARLMAAVRAARQDGHPVNLQPGQPFESWYPVLEPYLNPLIIGSPLTDGSTLTLAVAAQFPAWLVHAGKVRFTWSPDPPAPVLAIRQLNARLYRLTPHVPQELCPC